MALALISDPGDPQKKTTEPDPKPWWFDMASDVEMEE